jgi:hypothetical protein
MLFEVPPESRGQIRQLFAGLPGLKGCVHALLDGGMGRVWADDVTNPRVGVAQFDFYFLAGDAEAPAAEEAVGAIVAGASVVVSSAGWEPALRATWKARKHTRVEFDAPDIWDRERLQRFVDALPGGFTLKRIELADAARFTDLADSLTYNFPTLDDFVRRGVGFGIEHEGRYVAGCSSFAISPYSLEFEIQTHPDFRQRDLATVAAARMILHCLESGLEPCWDAHNDVSAALATKLGFVNPTPYTSYEIR